MIIINIVILQKVVGKWRCGCCRFRSVFRQKNGKYSAITRDEQGKVVYMGRYKAAEDAAKAIDVARVFLVCNSCTRGPPSSTPRFSSHTKFLLTMHAIQSNGLIRLVGRLRVSNPCLATL